MSIRRAAAAGTVVVATVVASGCGRASRGADSARASAPSDTSRARAVSDDRPDAPRGRPSGERQPTPVRPPGGGDTLQGTIRVVGSAVDEQVVVQPSGGGAAIALLGDKAPTLGRLSGTNVWLSGTRSGTRSFSVQRFLVRSVDGVPAMDGTLIARDGGFGLVTTVDHAIHPIVNPPAALRSHVGSRVWITGPLQTGAITFGVITDR